MTTIIGVAVGSGSGVLVGNGVTVSITGTGVAVAIDGASVLLSSGVAVAAGSGMAVATGVAVRVGLWVATGIPVATCSADGGGGASLRAKRNAAPTVITTPTITASAVSHFLLFNFTRGDNFSAITFATG